MTFSFEEVPKAMAEIQDDKAQQVIPFILEHLSEHQKQHKSYSNPAPFFVGLNGVQGAGKSVLVRSSSELSRTHLTPFPQSPFHSMTSTSLIDINLSLQHLTKQTHSSSTAGSLQHTTSLSPLTS